MCHVFPQKPAERPGQLYRRPLVLPSASVHLTYSRTPLVLSLVF
jgi:hypothetical protein